MSEQSPWADDGPKPFFFLSYAHTPRAASAGDPNHLVNQFFTDLCAHILELTDLPDDEHLGFIDRDMHVGEGWSQRISEALSRCRVFVPLFSPRYFRSLACGQEWSTFARRTVYPRQRGAAHETGIVPVLWAPVPTWALPSVARELQFSHADFGAEYETEGLAALRKLSDYRAAYEMAVYKLARRIVRVAEQTMIVPGRERDFQSVASCFDSPPPRRELRISVLAPDRGRLPAERSAKVYGATPVEWWPYPDRPESGLAAHAARIARQLDFHPTVHDFTEECARVLSAPQPVAPGLLLLDRWALLDPRTRALAARFDRHGAPWITLMEPWSQEDPECLAHDEALRRLADETLPLKRREPRPVFRGGHDGLPTLHAFEEELPRALLRAMLAFDDWVKPRSQHGQGGGRPRPSLRGDPPPEDWPPNDWRDTDGSGPPAGPEDGTS